MWAKDEDTEILRHQRSSPWRSGVLWRASPGMAVGRAAENTSERGGLKTQ